MPIYLYSHTRDFDHMNFGNEKKKKKLEKYRSFFYLPVKLSQCANIKCILDSFLTKVIFGKSVMSGSHDETKMKATKKKQRRRKKNSE